MSELSSSEPLLKRLTTPVCVTTVQCPARTGTDHMYCQYSLPWLIRATTQLRSHLPMHVT